MTQERPMVGKILNQDEKDQLLVYHLGQITKQQGKVEAAKAPVADAKADLADQQELLTKHFNAAKADLGRGYSREYLESLVKDASRPTRDLVRLETQRAHDKVVLGQPVFGQQPELFPVNPGTPDSVQDAMAWEMEGYKRGRLGLLQEIPDGAPTEHHQAILRAYQRGQEETQAQYLAGQAVKDRLGQPDTAPAVDLNGGADDLDPEKIDAEARKLKASGFMETGGPDADEASNEDNASDGEQTGEEFEASEEELAQQATRKTLAEIRAANETAA